jgi:hypothetical protein
LSRFWSVTLVLGAATAAVLALVTGSAGAKGAGVHSAACKSRIVNRSVHFCGPATAHLSVFRGVTFRNGTCRHQQLKSGPLLSLGLGVRTTNVATNGGRAYFGLTISGNLSHPTGGGVIAYANGKRWGGRGVSFKGTANAGTFVVRGLGGSKGTATGSYHC